MKVVISRWKWPTIVLLILLLINHLAEMYPLQLHLAGWQSLEGVDLTVLCYNVKSSDDNYETNQKGIAKEIITEMPDVIFLCEYTLYNSKMLDSVLCHGGYQRHYNSRSKSAFYCKCPIDSIKPIDTGRGVKKSLTNMTHVFMMKDTVAIVGCHLSSSRKDLFGGYKMRKYEADSISVKIQIEQHPLVVMGDMNDFSFSYPVRHICEKGLRDAWWEEGCGYGATFHSGCLSLRIDHILYSPDKLKLRQVKVIDSNYSDHNAILAKFNIIKK